MSCFCCRMFQVQPDYFLPALDDVIYQPQTGCNLTSDLWTTDNPFDGEVFASCDMMTDVQLGFEPIVGTMKQLLISWWATVLWSVMSHRFVVCLWWATVFWSVCLSVHTHKNTNILYFWYIFIKRYIFHIFIKSQLQKYTYFIVFYHLSSPLSQSLSLFLVCSIFSLSFFFLSIIIFSFFPPSPLISFFFISHSMTTFLSL